MDGGREGIAPMNDETRARVAPDPIAPDPADVRDPAEARRIAAELYRRGRSRTAGGFMARALVLELEEPRRPLAPVVDLAAWRRRRAR